MDNYSFIGYISLVTPGNERTFKTFLKGTFGVLFLGLSGLIVLAGAGGTGN